MAVMDMEELLRDLQDRMVTQERRVRIDNDGIMPLGGMLIWPTNDIPDRFMIADGRALNRLDYKELFAVLGTTYGSGDGSTTFNVPDMRGRVPVGVSAGEGEWDTIGEAGGNKYIQLSVSQLPAHNHGGTTGDAGYHNHTGQTGDAGYHNHTGGTSNSGYHTHTGNTSSVGDHTHNGGTDNQGNHNHGGGTGGGGGHSHSGTIGNAGYHGHTGLTVNGTRVNWGNSQRASGSFATLVANGNDSDVVVNSGGDHTHGLTINGVGDHGHGIGYDGGHTHGFTTNGAGGHNHSFETAGNGDHAHGFTTDSAGTHSHGFTTGSAGTHNHGFSTSNTGNNDGHPNMQPYRALHFVIRVK